MSYTGIGDLPATDWNDTKYPGVCKPTNFDALAKFKELQRQLNRMAFALSIPRIAVDGDIGPGTRSLITKIQAKLPSFSANPFETQVKFQSTSNCAAIAGNADVLANSSRMAADARGAPETVSGAITLKPSTIVTPSGQEVQAPAGSGFGPISEMSLPMKLVAGAALGLVGFLIWKEAGKGKGGQRVSVSFGKSVRRSAPRSRRRYGKSRRRSVNKHVIRRSRRSTRRRSRR